MVQKMKIKWKRSKHIKKYKAFIKIKFCYFMFVLVFERPVWFLFNLFFIMSKCKKKCQIFYNSLCIFFCKVEVKLWLHNVVLWKLKVVKNKNHPRVFSANFFVPSVSLTRPLVYRQCYSLHFQYVSVSILALLNQNKNFCHHFFLCTSDFCLLLSLLWYSFWNTHLTSGFLHRWMSFLNTKE